MRKLREIATSELALTHKLLYAGHLAAGLRRREHPGKVRRYRLRGGGSIDLRGGTTDRQVFEEVFLSKIYAPLAQLSKPNGAVPAVPLVLIDLGANIGLSAVYLARALRPAGIVAVEPDLGNYAMLVRNLHLAGIAQRSVAVQAFAGAERGYAQLKDSGNGAWGLRMGAPASSGIPVLPVAEIVALAAVPGFPAPRVILKCDIEGAERQLFERMHDWEHLADFVMLELHTEFFAEAELRACIEWSGYHWKLHGSIDPDSVLAVIGLQRLARKTSARGAAYG